MIEVFNNIDPKVKETARIIWDLAIKQPDPVKASDFLNTAVHFYENLYTNEEMDFLQFYFQMQMEMNKND